MFHRGIYNLKAFLTFQKQEIIKIPYSIFYPTVRDTHLYHEFIPWCSHSQIVQSLSQHQNYTKLTIRFNQFKELSYVSHVCVEEVNGKAIITSICKEHPLKYLKSVWTIEKIGFNDCNVHYFLDFQFSSIVYQLTSSFFMNIMGISMWNIFIQRAKSSHLLNKSTIQPEQTIKQSKKSEIFQALDYSLSQYLDQHQNIKEIYTKNEIIRQKIDKIYQRIQKTNNIKSKLHFEISNLLIHHDIYK